MPKTCTSCHRIISDEDWSNLPLLGLKRDVSDDPQIALELRNCTGTHQDGRTCGSTLSVEIRVAA